jgi:hypothetical protein
MRLKLIHIRITPILAREPVCLGFVIFLPNITRQRAIGDIWDRIFVEPLVDHTFRMDIIQ